MSTVLIVDDSKTSRFMLKRILEANGYEVVGEAENGQDGYDKYCQLMPDFVTLDITVTAAGQKGKMLDAIKLGAAEFVTKPFETGQIISIMESIK